MDEQTSVKANLLDDGIVDYRRRGTIRLATKTCTVSPFWFKVVVRTLTSP
jgi:hypothetical protein